MTIYATFVNLENGLTAEEAEIVSVPLRMLSKFPQFGEILERANKLLSDLDSDQIRSIEVNPTGVGKSDEIHFYVGDDMDRIRGDILFHDDPDTVRAIANAFGI